MATGYYTSCNNRPPFEKRLNIFYDEHAFCGNGIHNENQFELMYESALNEGIKELPTLSGNIEPGVLERATVLANVDRGWQDSVVYEVRDCNGWTYIIYGTTSGMPLTHGQIRVKTEDFWEKDASEIKIENYEYEEWQKRREVSTPTRRNRRTK